MRQRILALLLGLSVCGLCAHPLQAQTSSNTNTDYDKQFYLFASPNVAKQPSGQAFALAIGAGGEKLPSQHLAIGAELAESVLFTRFPARNAQQHQGSPASIFWLAFHGAYNFRRKDSPNRTRPFLIAGCGISGINNAGVGTQYNYGIGFNRWHTQHLGIRFEVRRFLHSGDSQGRITGMRIGLAIR